MAEASKNEQSRARGGLLITLGFLVPAAVILWKSIPLLLYMNTTKHPVFTFYIFYGGHLVTLLTLLFPAAFALQRWGPKSVSARKGILVFLGAIYLVVSGIAWVCLAAGVLSF
jgi:hypothetical protein